MSHYAMGHSWLSHQMQYRDTFHVDVPEWILVFDVPVKLDLIKVALRTGIPLAQTNLLKNDFHDG